MRRYVSILCHAAAHDSTQWHAVAAHLSIFAHLVSIRVHQNLT